MYHYACKQLVLYNKNENGDSARLHSGCNFNGRGASANNDLSRSDWRRRWSHFALRVRTELDPIDQSERPVSCAFGGGTFAISWCCMGIFVNSVEWKQRLVGPDFCWRVRWATLTSTGSWIYFGRYYNLIII